MLKYNFRLTGNYHRVNCTVVLTKCACLSRSVPLPIVRTYCITDFIYNWSYGCVFVFVEHCFDKCRILILYNSMTCRCVCGGGNLFERVSCNSCKTFSPQKKYVNVTAKAEAGSSNLQAGNLTFC